MVRFLRYRTLALLLPVLLPGVFSPAWAGDGGSPILAHRPGSTQKVACTRIEASGICVETAELPQQAPLTPQMRLSAAASARAFLRSLPSRQRLKPEEFSAFSGYRAVPSVALGRKVWLVPGGFRMGKRISFGVADCGNFWRHPASIVPRKTLDLPSFNDTGAWVTFFSQSGTWLYLLNSQRPGFYFKIKL